MPSFKEFFSSVNGAITCDNPNNVMRLFQNSVCFKIQSIAYSPRGIHTPGD
jgi:hypothetical protein